MTQPKTAARVPTSMATFAYVFLAVALGVYVCKIASDIMIPFVIAVFIWYLINAVARFLGLLHTVSGRVLPRFWRFVIAILLMLGLATLIFELVHQNIDTVIRDAPKFQSSFARIVEDVSGALHLDHVPSFEEMREEVMGKYVDIGTVVKYLATMLTDTAGKTLAILFFVGFLLYEQRYFDRKTKWMIADPEREQRFRAALRQVDEKIQKYIGVKALVSFLDSFLTFSILSAFSVDFAGFWGVMAFFLHFIPYAGSLVAIALPVLTALIQFSDIGTAFMVLAALSTSHAMLGHVLDPYLMGNNLNLSPIFIITNLAAWGMIWGVPGMFLAIPILAIVTLLMAQFEATRPYAILVSKTGVVD